MSAVGGGGVERKSRQSAISLQHIQGAAHIGGIEKRFCTRGAERTAGLIILRVVILCPVILGGNGSADDVVVEKEVVRGLHAVGPGRAVAQRIAVLEAIANDCVVRRVATGSGAIIIKVDIPAVVIADIAQGEIVGSALLEENSVADQVVTV